MVDIFSKTFIGLLTVLGTGLLVCSIVAGVFVRTRGSWLDLVQAFILYLSGILIVAAGILGFIGRLQH